MEELVEKDKQAFDKASKCKNIGELRKWAIENKIEFTEEELKHAWSYVQNQAPGKNDELNDNALDSVAGGGSKNPAEKGDANSPRQQ